MLRSDNERSLRLCLMKFELHPQLEKDSFLIKELSLSQLRLINDSQYPWFILVPKVAEIFEIHKLNSQQQQQLYNESIGLSNVLEDVYSPDKLNIAAIGNVVPQLHIHHIARFKNDACWPKPVWGQKPMTEYTDWRKDEKISEVIKRMN